MVTKVRTMRKMLSMMVLMVIVAAGFTIAAPENANAGNGGSNPTEAEWLPLNTDVYATVVHYKTNYYYKFTTDNMSGVTYTAKTVSMGNEHIKGKILDSDFNDYYSESGYSTFGAGPGEGNTSDKFHLKKNATYYVVMCAPYWGENLPYMLRLQKNITKPSKPIIESMKAGKKKFTIRYYKSNYATKYQIRYKVKGGYWSKIKNNGLKLKYTKKGLRSGKKYTVQVRGVRTVNGKNYVGKWSSKKTIKVR